MASANCFSFPTEELQRWKDSPICSNKAFVQEILKCNNVEIFFRNGHALLVRRTPENFQLAPAIIRHAITARPIKFRRASWFPTSIAWKEDSHLANFYHFSIIIPILVDFDRSIWIFRVTAILSFWELTSGPSRILSAFQFGERMSCEEGGEWTPRRAFSLLHDSLSCWERHLARAQRSFYLLLTKYFSKKKIGIRLFGPLFLLFKKVLRRFSCL